MKSAAAFFVVLIAAVAAGQTPVSTPGLRVEKAGCVDSKEANEIKSRLSAAVFSGVDPTEAGRLKTAMEDLTDKMMALAELAAKERAERSGNEAAKARARSAESRKSAVEWMLREETCRRRYQVLAGLAQAGKPLPEENVLALPISAEALEKWFDGIEVAEIVFEGRPKPAGDVFRQMGVKQDEKAEFFVEGNRVNAGLVRVWMKVSPENVQQVLKLQRQMATWEMGVGMGGARIWAQKGDAEMRKEARKLSANVLNDFAATMKSERPAARVEAKTAAGTVLAESTFAFGDGIEGRVQVAEMTAANLAAGRGLFDRWLVLPKMSLLVNIAFDAGATGADDRDAVGRAVEEAITPLIKRENAK